jgi:hypothetical protein
MKKVELLIIGVAFALVPFAAGVARTGSSILKDETNAASSAQTIKLTISTGGGIFGAARDRFKVGEEIPVTITMTNASPQAKYVCVSSPLYQDLPKLTKDGAVVPYMDWQSYELVNTQKNRTCQNESLPEPVLLNPDKATVVDWLVLADASEDENGWYDPLAPGHYQLSMERKMDCCDGPMLESNVISFDVVP